MSFALPAGFGLNRDAFAGRVACAPAQAGVGAEGPANCPAASRAETVRREIPAVRDALDGSIYFGGDDPVGGYVLYLTGSGPGLESPPINLDEDEGAVTAALLDLPQIRIQLFKLDLAGLPNPITTAFFCDTYDAAGLVTPWNSELPEQILGYSLMLDSWLNGTPCPGPASQVSVLLSPTRIVADGHSTTTATALVVDQHGNHLPGDEVVITSTDAGQKIGPVTDRGDGTYSAQIAASTVPGTPIITATDLSVKPPIFGAATLEQFLPAPAAAPAAAKPKKSIAGIGLPKTRITKKALVSLRPAIGDLQVRLQTRRRRLQVQARRPGLPPLHLSQLSPASHPDSTGSASTPPTSRPAARPTRPPTNSTSARPNPGPARAGPDGRYWSRTSDLLRVKQALSQLS